jgi:hypothetical protein
VDTKVWMYLVYLAVSIGLTVWVANTLSRNGFVFLEDVFGNERLAHSINHLLVVGFYLLNLGFVTVAMRVGHAVVGTASALEVLSWKVGMVLLVLGVMHFFNLFALGRYRRNRLRVTMPRMVPRTVGPLAPPQPVGPFPGQPAQPVGQPAQPPVPPFPAEPPQ